MAGRDLICLADEEAVAAQPEWKTSRMVSQDEFVLTKVLGLTNIAKSALDCNQATGYVAFPASCMLVLLDPKTNDQKFIKSPTGKNISCVSFSEDGRLVAMGEYGVKPMVSIWSLKDHREQSRFVVDHSVGVKTIAIHPKSPYVVVIGMQDLNIGVWDYNRCQRLALTKWQTIPLSMTIPRSGNSLILCGHRKIALFNLDKVDSNSYETNVFEDKKAVLLGRQSEYTFVDVTSGRGRFDRNVYTVTACGYLCEIRLGDILIDKAIKVDSRAFSVRFALNHVFVGCCEGVVKICNPDTLDIAVSVSLDQLLGASAFPQATPRLFLDTTAIAVNERDSIVTCIYSNCSIYSWQITNFTENFECSVLLPSPDDQLDHAELESCVSESVWRANMFRSLMGCLEFSKDCRVHDTETLAARNGMRCHHNLMHVIRGGAAKNQHVTAFRFSPDGRDVICGNVAGEIKVYDAATGVLRRVIEAHSAQVMCIELLYNEDRQLVCTGGRDRIIFILNAMTDFSLVQVLCDHSAAITAISLVMHDGLMTLVSAAADSLILVRRATPGDSLKFTVTGQIVESGCNKALNVSGDYIITGDKNGNIKLFKADPIFNPKLTKTLKSLPRGNHLTSVPRPMSIDPTGSFIASAQNPGQIIVYHLSTGQPIASLPAQTDATVIKFTSCLRYMISSTINGCTMIWRIPERMHEFLKAKRNKTYQIEIAKEVSYETTYLSCVKVCKELVPSDDPKEQRQRPNANHNYDSDATPSIESLSFLRKAHSCEIDSDRNSLCNSDSYISCSTCMDSSSDTIHWCASSDSSIQTNSAGISFCCANNENYMCDRFLKCRRVGPFRGRSDESLHTPDLNETMLIQKCAHKSALNSGRLSTKTDDLGKILSHLSSDPNIIFLSKEGFRTGFTGFSQSGSIKHPTMSEATFMDIPLKKLADKSPLNLESQEVVKTHHTILKAEIRDVTKRKDGGESPEHTTKTSILETITSNTLTERLKATVVSPEGDVSLKDKSENGSSTRSNRRFSVACKQPWNPIRSPTSNLAACFPTSPTSLTSYRTACSPRLTNSLDASSSTGNNSIFLSPSPCLSLETEGSPAKKMTNRDSPDKGREAGGDGSNTAGIASDNAVSLNGKNALTPADDASRGTTVAGGLSPADPACQATSAATAGTDRDTDPNPAAVFRAVSLEQSSSVLKTSCVFQANFSDVSKRLNSEFSSAEKFSCRKDVEEPISTQVHIKQDDHKKEIQPKSAYPCGVEVTKCETPEEELPYNYHSITRDETGKLRLVGSNQVGPSHKSLSHYLSIKSPPSLSMASGSPRRQHEPELLQDCLVRNIQCSRCTHKDDTSPTAHSGENANKTANCEHPETVSDSVKNFLENANRNEEKLQELNKNFGVSEVGSVKGCLSEDSHNDLIKEFSDPRLQEYFSELRQCLQLTNSQETVYKLACDAQDHELTELLTFVLKKHPAYLHEADQFLPGQFDMLRNLVEADGKDLMAAGGLQDNNESRTTALGRPTTVCGTAEGRQDRLGNEEHLQSIGESASPTYALQDVQPSQRITGKVFDRSQNAAHALVNLVGQILHNRRAVVKEQGDQKSCSRTEGHRTSLTPSNTSALSGQYRAEGDFLEASSLREFQPVRSQKNAVPDNAHEICGHVNLRNSNTLPSTNGADGTNNQYPSGFALEQVDALLSNQVTSGDSNGLAFCSHRTHELLGPSASRQECSRDSALDACTTDRLTSPRHTPSDLRDDQSVHDSGVGLPAWTPGLSPVPTRVLLADTSQMGPGTGFMHSSLQSETIKEAMSVDNSSPLSQPTRETPLSTASVTERKYSIPINDLWRDQGDYLRKLKEAREVFELSIRAISNERKSRMAEEEAKLHHK